MTLPLIIWILMGVGGFMYGTWRNGEFTVGDIPVAIVGGLFGPLTIFILLIVIFGDNGNKVIWRRKI